MNMIASYLISSFVKSSVGNQGIYGSSLNLGGFHVPTRSYLILRGIGASVGVQVNHI